MNDRGAKEWAFIFNKLGEETLREMLYKVAVEKEDDGRVVIEFDGNEALNITGHVEELEKDL